MSIRSGFASLLVLALPVSAFAQWVQSGTPLANTISSQHVVAATSDGAGGAIIVWDGYRSPAFQEDIYAQRISASGVPLWTTGGIPICTASSFQYYPEVVSDGVGGAIITWFDGRNFGLSANDIYAQRINASGTALWTVDGVVVCNASNNQEFPRIAADGSGGAFITWQDFRNGANQDDIFVQRINSAGASLWTANGVNVANVANEQISPRVVSDGAGGVIVVWQDVRTPANNYDIYAQRLNNLGTPQWSVNGIPVCVTTGSQDNPFIINDGGGGAILAWYDYRGGSTNDIVAQRVNSAGTTLWTLNGAVVCDAAGYQPQFNLISDGAQGAIFAWTDDRGPNDDVYAQRMGSAGKPLWNFTGVPVCTVSGFRNGAQLVSDGAGGAVITWSDGRIASPTEMYGQRLDANGITRWSTDGVRLTNSLLSKWNPAPMVPDGNGNAITAWYSFISTESSVWAQRVDGRYGYWGKPDPTLYAVKDVPADQGGKVRLEWYASGRDVLNQDIISHYTIWRAIDQAAFATAAAAGVPEVKLGDPASKLRGIAIRHDRPLGIDYFWQLVGQQDAIYRNGYAFDAATSFDSTATSTATTKFQIVAHALNDPQINWPSNVIAGRSVDNVAPPAPLFLTAQRIGNYVYLKWKGVHVKDLDKYTVYRKTTTGVTPIPANFLADNPDTLLTDSTAPTSALYYIVTATDIHQNQGLKSNEASVAATTGVGGNLPPVTALTVLQNSPNPFAGETRLQVGLPDKGDVRVEIYDVAGRHIRSVQMPAQAKGWNTLRISALDDRGAALASGVYFFRVHAGAETVTKKMVIAR